MTALKPQMFRRPGQVFCALAICALVLVSARGSANDAAALKPLEHPGTHAIMRHALAPGMGDPPGFRLDDCSSQRNLDDQGRAQARRLGEAFKATGIRFDKVLTSQWCRCRETAALLEMGTPSTFSGLNSFFQDRSTAAAQTEQVRGFLRALPTDEKVLLVTHQVNITALTGRGVSSGEVLLIQSDPDGVIRVIGEFLVPPG